MGQLCDFCGEQRSIVYCRSDAACLCLSCDRNVHSANALSRRHSRTLLCERCNSHPAMVRCVEEKVSLCQNCDWIGHGSSTSTLVSPHKRQPINCYSGCPSAAELSRIWSFVLELPCVDDSNCEQEMGLMSLTENSVGNSSLLSVDSATDLAQTSRVKELDIADKSNIMLVPPPLPVPSPISPCIDHLIGSMSTSAPKVCCPGTKEFEICGQDDLYQDFNMSDMDLGLESYEELFGVAQNNEEHFFENVGIDSLFGTKEMAGTDTGIQGAHITEGPSAPVKEVQPACSNPVSADSIMSSKTDPNLYFPARQAHSSLSLSFSGLTGENSTGDYQDCGVSSRILIGEPPWYPPCPENSLSSSSRSSAVLRYKEKKKTRKFEKKIRYASRKARADVRKRVKGRFVKAGDAYDYDPLCQTRSC
ncbi:CCT domain [Dillenia turbinata]|uniref:CCT domain n=1 Tax=Dillenia turbinata TaxID=194707 RepID=A0AAN8VNQ4_9MAGN